jgi:hypothetical protein
MFVSDAQRAKDEAKAAKKAAKAAAKMEKSAVSAFSGCLTDFLVAAGLSPA